MKILSESKFSELIRLIYFKNSKKQTGKGTVLAEGIKNVDEVYMIFNTRLEYEHFKKHFAKDSKIVFALLDSIDRDSRVVSARDSPLIVTHEVINIIIDNYRHRIATRDESVNFLKEQLEKQKKINKHNSTIISSELTKLRNIQKYQRKLIEIHDKIKGCPWYRPYKMYKLSKELTKIIKNHENN